MISNSSPIRSPSVIGGPPLDYSFKDLKSLSDVENEQPRRDVTFSKSPEKSEKNSEKEKSAIKPTFAVKQIISSVNLSNNQISDISQLGPILSLKVPNVYQNLSILDVSFNKITTFSNILIHFPNLMSIYLHSNALEDISEVLELRSLPRLRNLSLMNNPLQTKTLPRVSRYPEVYREERLEYFKAKYPNRPIPLNLLPRDAHGRPIIPSSETAPVSPVRTQKSPVKSNITAHKEASNRAAQAIAAQRREMATYCRYRLFIIGSIPTLKSLDYTGITWEDSEVASVWMQEYMANETAWEDEEERRRLRSDDQGSY
eukprot:GDKJ01048214.1.p1 GENE.GDKJ01048214.1~~GDKJ01048214.1.p1  ORF type:complete len:315 (-),score=53.72 GDKJ01048214.1:88-1032(-)